jgi:hypothetical protein
MTDTLTPVRYPVMRAGDFNKEVLFNEANVQTGTLFAGVLSASTTSPPLSPADSDAYIIPAGATGLWSGRAGQIAMWVGGWRYMLPFPGPQIWVADVGQWWTYDGDTETWGAYNPGAGVIGPGTSAVGHLAIFDTTGGDSLADSGVAVSTDGTLAAASDAKLPTEQAVKTYVDAAVAGAGDVAGPGVSVSGNLAAFSGTGGDVLADTGVAVSTDGTMAANSDANLPTEKAVRTYLATYVAAQDSLAYKGAIDASSNPNYPAADAGHTYRISVAGKIGGASGVNVQVGDMVICLADGTAAGNQATVGASWNIIQANIDGAVLGPASVTSGLVALFDGTTGKLIKSGTLTDVLDLVGGAAQGDLLYRGAAGWDRLAAGTSGQYLKTLGSGNNPTWDTPSGGGGGLTNWTEGANSSSPNATVPVVYLLVNNGATNVDAALISKGTGATLAQVPDSLTAGGNKRGVQATDWQKLRSAAAEVASGGYAVIGGGRNNTASATNATIAGGQGCSATQTHASVGGGVNNAASGQYSTIPGGEGNTASNYAAFCAGSQNTASGQYSASLGGRLSTADADYASTVGYHANARGIQGAHARASGGHAASGDAQCREFILRGATTNATPANISTNGSPGSSNNQIVLANNSLFAFQGQLVVRENATGDSKAIEFKGAIKRGANAASTALLGAVTQADIGTPDAGSATWTLAITANTSTGCLQLEVTGEASHNLKWTATVRTTEVVG